ncbi:MAG: accessory gene regulator B family protein [Ruminococcus sp.]|nr:accessory gene regulator B family protein [Ruminococcus sp.]
MLNSLSTMIANKFFDDNDKYPKEIYIYGIELLISSFISTSVILLIGLLTKTFFESVIFLISFSAIRVYTGGYHSMTYLRCNIISASSYVAVIIFFYLFRDLITNPIVLLSGYFLTMILALVFAPVKHENKRLDTADIKKYKLLSLLMITVVFAVYSIGYCVFEIEPMLIISPTYLSIDIAMIVSVVKNYINSRRN